MDVAARLNRADLVLSVTEIKRHWSPVVDAILPHEGAIGVTRRGRLAAYLIAPWLWTAMLHFGAGTSDLERRARVEVELRSRFARQFKRPIPLEIGPGWMGLMGDMLAEVEGVLRRRRKRLAWTQLASKYATLRADFETVEYARPWAREIEAIVERYEEISATRCERCGRPGEQRERAGWLFVACEEHV